MRAHLISDRVVVFSMTLLPGLPDASKSSISGTAISSATVGIPATFTVNTRDAFGNAYVDKPGGGTWYSPYDGPARFAVILKNIRKGVEVGLGRNRSTPLTLLSYPFHTPFTPH